MYVIKRKSDGAMLSKPGSEKSYTYNLLKARIFTNEQKAKDSCCSNEYVADVSNLLQPEE